MKHLELRQKYSAARRIFNSLLDFSFGDETLRLMLDILGQKTDKKLDMKSAMKLDKISTMKSDKKSDKEKSFTPMISTHLFCVNGNPPCYINLFVLFFRHSGILRMLFLCEENLQYRQSRLTLFHHRQTFCGTEKKHSHEKFPLLREHKFGLIVNFPYWYLCEVIFST